VRGTSEPTAIVRGVKAIWVEETDEPDFGKYRTLGIDRIYVDIREQMNPVERVSKIRRQGFTAGVYWGQAWGESAYKGADFAAYISTLIGAMEAKWRANHDSVQCEFQLDLETVNGRDHTEDNQWMIDFLREWRRRRPSKVTSWTLEVFQGGQWTWMTRALVNIINTDVNLLVVPQLYQGALENTVDSAAASKDLRFMRLPDGSLGGIREDRIKFFYNAADYPRVAWDGYLFTNRKLA